MHIEKFSNLQDKDLDHYDLIRGKSANEIGTINSRELAPIQEEIQALHTKADEAYKNIVRRNYGECIITLRE